MAGVVQGSAVFGVGLAAGIVGFPGKVQQVSSYSNTAGAAIHVSRTGSMSSIYPDAAILPIVLGVVLLLALLGFLLLGPRLRRILGRTDDASVPTDDASVPTDDTLVQTNEPLSRGGICTRVPARLRELVAHAWSKIRDAVDARVG